MTSPWTPAKSTTNIAATCSVRRGAVAVAAVLVLVILQLVIVSMVIGGARESDMTVQRLDSARAFYAAEASMNMAIREVVSYADDDEDGQSGGISNDSNPNNDITTVAGARALSIRSDVSGVTTIESDGRSGSCKRKIVATIADGTIAGRRVIYSQWPNQNPQFRIWTGANWGPASNTLDFGAKQYWAVMRRCPIRQEVMIACSIQLAIVKAAVQTGNTWGSLVTGGDAGTVDQRPFSIAYEQTSGRALLVYRNGSSPTLYYRIWDGSAWSSEQSTSSPLTGNPTFIKLVPRPASNEILLYVLDSNNAIAAMVWNGASFGNKVTLETSAPTSTRECIDAAYETGTGRCMVIWSRIGRNEPRYALWDGSAWSATTTMADLGAVGQWFHLAADPVSAKLMLGVSDSSSRVNVSIWNGSSWSSYQQVESNAPTLDSRCFDVAFEPLGTRGLVVYGHNTTVQPRYRVYDGTTWSGQSSAPSMPGTPFLVQLTPSGGGREIMTLMNCTGGQNRLEFMRWNGTSFVNIQELEPNVSGPAGAEVFMVPDEPPVQVPRLIQAWVESQP